MGKCTPGSKACLVKTSTRTVKQHCACRQCGVPWRAVPTNWQCVHWGYRSGQHCQNIMKARQMQHDIRNDGTADKKQDTLFTIDGEAVQASRHKSIQYAFRAFHCPDATGPPLQTHIGDESCALVKIGPCMLMAFLKATCFR